MTTDRVNARLLSAILAVVSIAILLLVIIPRDDAGELVIRGDLEKSRLVLDVTKLTLDTYSELLQLLGASFGVVSFLVGYHRENHLQLRSRVGAAVHRRSPAGDGAAPDAARAREVPDDAGARCRRSWRRQPVVPSLVELYRLHVLRGS